jgi:hypothetical protein
MAFTTPLARDPFDPPFARDAVRSAKTNRARTNRSFSNERTNERTTTTTTTTRAREVEM